MAIPVKIKRLHKDAVIPKYAHKSDVCFDLVSVEDVIITPGQTAKIPTGWAMQQPEGYAIEIRPRSGISERTKLRIANSPGTIDAYTGEIGVLIDNIAQYPDDDRPWMMEGYIIFGIDGKYHHVSERESEGGAYIIRKGDRVAQALVVPFEQSTFEEVEDLCETERGNGGFGSSGVTSDLMSAIDKYHAKRADK